MVGDLRLRHPLAALAAVYGAVALVLAGAVVAAEASGLPRGYFSRRPLAGAPCVDLSCFFAGLVSRAALMAWVACAASLLLLGYLERRGAGRPSERAGMLLSAGALTAVMSLDEAFLLHDVFAVLVPGGKVLFYLAYAAAAATLLVTYRSLILRSSAWVLALALGLLAASVCLDQVTTREFVEDAAKLSGVGTWSVYLIGTGLVIVGEESERRTT